MNITTEINLLGEREVSYISPITDKRVVKTVVDFATDVPEIRLHELRNLVNELYKRSETYYTNLLKFCDVSLKAKRSIADTRKNTREGMTGAKFQTNLNDLAFYIYQHIYPYFAMCKYDSKEYARLLQCLENQLDAYCIKNKLPQQKLESLTI